jgi:NAD(P)-dependent dehydrogenase (short-subunit alcohol dehydrogenase family)
MECRDKVAVVTGGGSGIGLALTARLIREGATVAVFDIDSAARDGTEELGASFYVVDVGSVQQTRSAIDVVEDELGPIDLFCANAGVLVQGGLEVTDDRWRFMWQVNVMGGLHAAQVMVPRWVDRGAGYLLLTASAAGLLTGLGALPYSVSKHATVALAEWVAIEHGPAGIKVSCLCPQSVDTPMHNSGGRDAEALAATGMASGVLSSEEVARATVEGLAAERFLILPHPEVAGHMARKAADYDRWLAGMARLRGRMLTATTQPS